MSNNQDNGNAAAIREAAAEFVSVILDKKPGIHNLHRLAEKCRDALAKPPRNCDRFGGDPKMLHTAWFDWSGSPSGCNPDGTVKLTFGEWLLATEKKGGAM